MREVPIDWYYDADSRVRPAVDTIKMTLDLLRIRLLDARGAYRRSPFLVSDGELEARRSRIKA